MSQPCAILLIEDDAPVRKRLARIITDWPDGKLITSCANLNEALKQISKNTIDLLITDLRLPDGNGIEAIRFLRKEQPEAEAMVISVLGDQQSVFRAIESGAAGFLLKDAESFNLIGAIKELMAGGSPVSPAIARTIIKRAFPDRGDAGKRKEDDPVKLLTKRETEILQGVAKGLTNTELSEIHGISYNTVPVHIRNIYRKLETHNRSEAVYEAVRMGLIDME